MGKPSYISLHGHSYFSTLDAISRPLDWARTAQFMGMSALAITDHGNMYGIPEFYDSCKQVGIKPILGVEAYMVNDIKERGDFFTASGKKSRSGHHIILLAKNRKGYQNIVQMINIANTEGFYYYPKIDWPTLDKYKEGVIATSACISGELAQAALGGDPRPVAARFKAMFGSDYYIEVMENSMVNDIQRNLNKRFIGTAKELGIKIIPTCDSHYLDPSMQPIHDIVLCIRDKKPLSDPERFHYDGLYHMKTPDEMATLFPDFMNNTYEVAEKVEEFDLYDKKIKLPSSSLEPNGFLRGMAEAGLRDMKLDHLPEYAARLNYELKTIEECNFAPYFLATKSIIGIIQDLKCPMGWGRGSAGGSLVCYVLGITDIDPIKWGLLFERFVNKTRPDQPDIDIDVPQGRRLEVVSEIFKHFGNDKVAHICTIHSFKPKMLIRDVCKILEEPQGIADELCKLVPFDAETYADIRYAKPKAGESPTEPEDSKFWTTLNKVTRKDIIIKTLGALLAQDADSHKDSRMTVGAPRHIGTHASGILISNETIKDHLPIKMDGTKMASQYDMDYVSAFGFLKFDILGLKTLDVIHNACKDVGIDIRKIPLDDKKTFDLIGEGKVVGVFQLDGSKSYMDLCKRMKPRDLKEVNDLVSLHRPGVMDSDQLERYLRRREGMEVVTYPHPTLETVLGPSYGICIFQEDMMKLAVEFAGYDAVDAENLRRTISKKIQTMMDAHKIKFIEKAKDLKRSNIEAVWEIIAAGARYSWNKAHAAEYGMVTYVCAYLSANHPLQFYKNLITLADPEDKPVYLSECLSRKIKVLPPDVNKSEKDVTIEGDAIRLGLLSIKGIGDSLADRVIVGRPYKTINQALHTISKNVISSLYTVGGMDSIPDASNFTPVLKASEEELLGMSVRGKTGQYAELIELGKITPLNEISGSGRIIVTVQKIHEVPDRKKRKMCFLTGADVFGGNVDLVMFADLYAADKPKKGVTYAMVVTRTAQGSARVDWMGSPEEVLQDLKKPKAP